MRSDVIGVVEAAYRLDLEESAWLEGIAQAAHPLLDRGLGIVTYTLDRRPTEITVGPVVSLPFNEPMNELARTMLGVMPPLIAERLLEIPVGYGASSELAGPEAIAGFLGENPFKMIDTAGVQGIDPSGASVWIVVPSQNVVVVEPGERSRWQRVAAHMTAAIRLRRSLARSAHLASDLDSADAVFEVDGSVANAKPDAVSSLDHLRAFAKNIDRARGKTRREAPEESLELWRGLCDGTWSLVDQSDSDGRRYFVARRNDPAVREDRALTRRELQVVTFAAFGHPDKLIAYELGIAEGTVQRHLTAAMAKMGVSARLELIRLALSLMG